MIKFIALTLSDSTKVTVNMDHLVRYTPLSTGGTNVIITGGDFITAIETKDQIDSLLMTSGCEIWERAEEETEEES